MCCSVHRAAAAGYACSSRCRAGYGRPAFQLPSTALEVLQFSSAQVLLLAVSSAALLSQPRAVARFSSCCPPRRSVLGAASRCRSHRCPRHASVCGARRGGPLGCGSAECVVSLCSGPEACRLRAERPAGDASFPLLDWPGLAASAEAVHEESRAATVAATPAGVKTILLA